MRSAAPGSLRRQESSRARKADAATDSSGSADMPRRASHAEGHPGGRGHGVMMPQPRRLGTRGPDPPAAARAQQTMMSRITGAVRAVLRGRQFSIRDLNGYTLVEGAEVPIGRMQWS